MFILLFLAIILTHVVVTKAMLTAFRGYARFVTLYAVYSVAITCALPFVLWLPGLVVACLVAFISATTIVIRTVQHLRSLADLQEPWRHGTFGS
jgi:hypothetical protein